ncbi:MAG: hypothetical protein M3O30_19385, partial [Planctomycetota bacterium]|nr:hypothetical protein [Planctomycetota bacterium]
MTCSISDEVVVSAVADTEPASDRRRIWKSPIWAWAGLGILLLGYVFFLHLRFAPAISEPDDNGYFAQATLLAQEGKTWFVPASDAQYIGIHWLLTPTGQFI